MADFKLQEENIPTAYRPVQKQNQGIVTTIIIKIGLAKNPQQANAVMLGITAVLFIFLVWFLIHDGSSNRAELIDNTDPLTGLPMEIPN